MLDAQLLVVELIRCLRPIVDRVRIGDVDLSRQLVRAASGVALNLAEGTGRKGADRRRVYRIAAAEAQEVRAAIEVVAAWGLADEDALIEARGLADRVGAVTHVLAR